MLNGIKPTMWGSGRNFHHISFLYITAQLDRCFVWCLSFLWKEKVVVVAESGNEHQRSNLAFHSFVFSCNCLLRKASERTAVFFLGVSLCRAKDIKGTWIRNRVPTSFASIHCATFVTTNENEGPVLVHPKRWECLSQSSKTEFTSVLLKEDIF